MTGNGVLMLFLAFVCGSCWLQTGYPFWARMAVAYTMLGIVLCVVGTVVADGSISVEGSVGAGLGLVAAGMAARALRPWPRFPWPQRRGPTRKVGAVTVKVDRRRGARS